MKKISFLTVPLLIVAIASLLSCQRLVSSDDVVATYHNPDIAFAGYKTYAMPDSVVLVGDMSAQTYLNSKYQAQVLNSINSNMASIGYVKKANKDSVDLVILPTVVISSQPYAVNSGYSINSYWGWYEPDWDFDWGWDYGWEVDTYTYETGTILIQMVDQKNPGNNNKKLNSVWAAYINGVIYNNENITAAISKDINQAFTQSQYLVIN
jgi:hypothetical protein